MIDVDYGALADVISQFRIWWVQLGISAGWAWLLILAVVFVWQSPKLLAVVLEHRRLEKDLENKSKLIEGKLKRERGRRGKGSQEER